MPSKPPNDAAKRRRVPRPYATDPNPPHPDPWPEPHGEAKRIQNLRARFPEMFRLHADAVKAAREAEQADLAARFKGERLAPESVVPPLRKHDARGPDGQVLRGPTAVRAEWIDPDDNNPNRRTAKRVQGHRNDVIRGIFDTGRVNPNDPNDDTGKIKWSHMRAVERYRRDYEVGHLRGMPGRWSDNPGIRGSEVRQNWPEDVQLQALFRFRAVTKQLNESVSAVLWWVVLENKHLKTFAAWRGISDRDATGYLILALDALKDAYGEKDERKEDVR
jgi:hypothetical protein